MEVLHSRLGKMLNWIFVSIVIAMTISFVVIGFTIPVNYEIISNTTNYEYGDEFIKPTIKLKTLFNRVIDVSSSDIVIDDFSTNVIGDRNVKCYFNKYSFDYAINVKEKQLSCANSDYEIEDGIINFVNDKYCSGYRVSLNNKVTNVENGGQYNIYEQDILDGSTNVVEIVKLGKEGTSISSEKTTINIIRLSEVKNITNTYNLLKWDNVSNASGYVVKIGEIEYKTLENSFLVPTTSLQVGESIIKVKAISNSGNIISSSFYPFTASRLDKPNVTYYDGEVTVRNSLGTEVDVTSYKLYIDGIEIENKIISDLSQGNHDINCSLINENYFESDFSDTIIIKKLATPNISIANNNIIGISANTKLYVDGIEFDGDFSKLSEGEHSLTGQEIASMSTEINSNISTNYIFSKLTSVNNIEIENGLISWKPIENVSQYKIVINTHEIEVTDSKWECIKSYFSDSNNSLSIVCLSNSEAIVNSNEVMFNIVKLPTPIIIIQNQQIQFSNKETSMAYTVYVDGKIKADKDISNVTAGEHKIKCVYSQEGKIDSEYSNEVTITKLSVPTLSIANNLIQGTTIKTQLYLDGVEFDGNLTEVESGAHTLTGKNIASTASEIDSSLSTGYTFRKLSSVSNIALSNGVLTWDSVSNAESYVIKIGTKEVEITTKQWVIEKGYFNEGTNTIKIKGLSSEETVLSSDEATFTLSKLVAPVITIENKQIQFSNKETGMTYIVFVDGAIKTDKDISNVTAGEHKIKCVYSQEGKIDSEYSNEVTITKLSVPTLSIADNVIQGTTIKTQLYLDGVEFDGDLTEVESGPHTLTGKNIASTTSEIDSSLSNEYTFIVPGDDIISISYNMKYQTLSWQNSNDVYVTKIVLMQYDSSDILLATREDTVSKTAYYQEYPILKSNATKFHFEITITGDGDNIISKTITKDFYKEK